MNIFELSDAELLRQAAIATGIHLMGFDDNGYGLIMPLNAYKAIKWSPILSSYDAIELAIKHEISVQPDVGNNRITCTFAMPSNPITGLVTYTLTGNMHYLYNKTITLAVVQKNLHFKADRALKEMLHRIGQ